MEVATNHNRDAATIQVMYIDDNINWLTTIV